MAIASEPLQKAQCAMAECGEHLLSMTCRCSDCNDLFCLQHRHPKDHKCKPKNISTKQPLDMKELNRSVQKKISSNAQIEAMKERLRKHNGKQ